LSDASQNRLASWGLRATWIYLIILFGGIPVLGNLGAIELSPVSLNELGDFLAGAFGPLAIFWIVLGFFQQGRELKNSVATLELQAKELANSVTQQKELVSVTRETLAHERELLSFKESQRKRTIQPTMQISFQNTGSAGADRNIHRLKIFNTGESASNFRARLTYKQAIICSVSTVHFKNGGELESTHYGALKIFDQLELKTEYTDRDGDAHTLNYLVQHQKDESWRRRKEKRFC